MGDGHGCPGPQAAPRIGIADPVGPRRQEGGHGREDRSQVSVPGHPAERGQGAPHVPHPSGPVRRRLAGGRPAADGRAPADGQDPVRVGEGRVPRPVRREPSADVRAAGPPLAGDVRPGPRGDVSAGPRGRRPGQLRLHVDERPGRHRPGPAVRPLGVPLRADALELGGGDGVCVGVVRGVGRRVAECPVGTGRCPAPPPQRQPERGGQQPVGEAGVPDAVSGPARPLRDRRGADQRPAAARERGQRVGPRAPQGGGRSGPAGAGEPRLHRPPGVRRVPARRGGRTERRPRLPLRGRASRVAAPAAAADGRPPPRDLPGRFEQPDPHPPEHILGPQQADWRNGRGPPVGRPGRGVVRRPAGGHAPAAGRPGPARGELPARDRLAGSQAGGVRPLPLPRGLVPHQPVPDGLRPAVRRPGRAGRGEGVPANPPARRPGRRGGCGRRPAGAARP